MLQDTDAQNCGSLDHPLALQLLPEIACANELQAKQADGNNQAAKRGNQPQGGHHTVQDTALAGRPSKRILAHRHRVPDSIEDDEDGMGSEPHIAGNLPDKVPRTEDQDVQAAVRTAQDSQTFQQAALATQAAGQGNVSEGRAWTEQGLQKSQEQEIQNDMDGVQCAQTPDECHIPETFASAPDQQAVASSDEDAQTDSPEIQRGLCPTPAIESSRKCDTAGKSIQNLPQKAQQCSPAPETGKHFGKVHQMKGRAEKYPGLHKARDSLKRPATRKRGAAQNKPVARAKGFEASKTVKMHTPGWLTDRSHGEVRASI